ncbi:flagellar hook-basal body complex protein FliE [Alicyclobacillus fodiniaquatilis]|uniref:Flagellar hook-basal body complex protein FliE n=1 Tax=Alicyclobacillus fodiniaquatilis TaxID=1661150 RepID=A0ABW4JI15_9BACL
MVIQAVSAVSNAMQGTATPKLQTGSSGPSFSAFLGQELDKVNQITANADADAQSYATGGSVTAAQLMIAEEQASLAVDTVSQVSSRVQNAYSTMMNMQV